MSGVEGLQQVGRFGAAHLADDDVIGPVPQGVAHEVADRERCSSSDPRAGRGAFPQGEPQPRGAVTRRAVAQRRSRASGLTRLLVEAIRGV